MMNILVLTSSYPKHQEESTSPYVRDLYELMAKNGCNIHIILPHAEDLPKYELRKLQPQGTLENVAGTNVPMVKFDQLCLQETLIPADNGKVILKDNKGKCGGTQNSYGSGTAIRVAGRWPEI